ncbi:MAG: M1 family metallopeptidase [Crocinitomicaceae bacterium]
MYKIYKLSLLAIILLVAFSCTQNPAEKPEIPSNIVTNKVYMKHSYSNVNKVKTVHLHLELDVNFESNVIYGVARHDIKQLKKVDTMILDVKNLDIQKITLGEKGQEVETNYLLGQTDELLGQPLFVRIDTKTTKVNIYYKTTQKTEAIDWLPEALTQGKQHPFMYTQGEAILTRSWIPIQDIPSNRITYSADIKVPNNLIALMSADNPVEKNETGLYHFEMKQAIPSYLISLAAGDIVYKELGPNCGVYAEPGLIDTCAYEFEDLPEMMNAAEKIYGKYRWEQYDVLVLPYSFPFGGMENPRLTFVSPTLLTGDRSLVSVIAHELAHSWSGNLVTNSTWEDFWLNEGFTVYFENRIMEELYGKEKADILAFIEFQELQHELKVISSSEFPEDTQLKLDLKGRDPDAGMTSIAYVKGAFFLKTLENYVGRLKFDQFMKKYFNEYAFKTLTTQDFESFLNRNLLLPNKVEFNTKQWLYNPGLPSNCIKLNPPRFKKMQQLATDFYNGIKGLNSNLKRQDFLTQEWQVFIRALPAQIDTSLLIEIDQQLEFKSCGNSEIMTEWYVLAIKNNYKGVREEMYKFLTKVGRRKYIEPIYNALVQKEEDREWAIKTFEVAKSNYHYVSSNTIASILNISNQ